MTPSCEFLVGGLPKGQPRPRAFARKMGDKFVARVFDAGTAEEWKGQVALAATKHRPAEPFQDAVQVRLYFLFPRPRSHFKTDGKRLKDSAPERYTKKPDADNLAKAVLDAITQLGGFWKDDAQVTRLVVTKNYSTLGSGCLVEIQEDILEE